MVELHDLIEGLSAPAAYPYPAETVEVRQTHISVVFLVGPYAYKIKKPVNFGFLDCTDLQRRLNFCQEEVQLNRRLAKDVYLGVVPVTRSPSGFHMEGTEGETIESAVKMKRLRDEDSFAERLACGDLRPEHLAELGRRLAAFHRSAERSPAIAESARFENVKRLLSENLEQASQCAQGCSHKVIDRVTRLTDEALAGQRERIEGRTSEGWPCDGHGDLRLEHVYLPSGPASADLVIVDCIEFSERYRHADPVSDVAFLVMDLDYHGRGDLARAFTESYFSAAGDNEGRSLIPLYGAYRAIVRAKVEALKASETEVPADERATALNRVKAYWLLALGKLELRARQPLLILVGGLPGTGKSTLARRLAETQDAGPPGFIVLRSDEIRKELAGIAGTQAASEFKTGIYTAQWTERTYAECLRRAEQALCDGERVIIDASFSADVYRHRFLNLARQLCVPAVLLICRADQEIVRRRLSERQGDVSDANWKIHEQAAQAWEPLSPGSLAAAHFISTDDSARALAEAQAVLANVRDQ